MTYDPTDIIEALDAETRAEQTRQAIERTHEEDLVELMRQPIGRRFVAKLIDDSGCNARSFDPANPNPHVTAFNEGRRDVGRKLQEQVHLLCPELFDEMLRERAAELRRLKKEFA